MNLTAITDPFVRPFLAVGNLLCDLAGIPEYEPLNPAECWDECGCPDSADALLPAGDT